MTAEHALLTVREVAQQLRCHERQVRRIINAGKLRAVRLGLSARSDRIHPDDLHQFIQGERKPQWLSEKEAMRGSSLSATREGSIVALLATGREIRRRKLKASS